MAVKMALRRSARTFDRRTLFAGHKNDLWIAAHARARGWKLVSNNTREFERVEGLSLENWVEA